VANTKRNENTAARFNPEFVSENVEDTRGIAVRESVFTNYLRRITSAGKLPKNDSNTNRDRFTPFTRS